MEAKRTQTPPNESETLGYITREQLEKFARAMRREEIEYITMELLVGSLFPNLYKNICYEYCPEETTKNKTNKRCSCNFYIYYVNKEKTDYECLKENEKCRDKKKYNIRLRKQKNN